MFKKELVKLTFLVTPEEKELIERAMSVRGNFGVEASVGREMGKALVMICKIVLSDYEHPLELTENEKSSEHED